VVSKLDLYPAKFPKIYVPHNSQRFTSCTILPFPRPLGCLLFIARAGLQLLGAVHYIHSIHNYSRPIVLSRQNSMTGFNGHEFFDVDITSRPTMSVSQ